MLIGVRRYLVAKRKADTEGPLRYYVAEKIRSAELTGESFVREPGFNIDQHAQKAFGAFQNDSEYGEVIWKFKPDVASHARAFLFHPTQVLEDLPDGSLLVRFNASGVPIANPIRWRLIENRVMLPPDVGFVQTDLWDGDRSAAVASNARGRDFATEAANQCAAACQSQETSIGLD